MGRRATKREEPGAVIDTGHVRYACTSPCGKYRYRLGRRWGDDDDPRTVNFVLLNPSTADHEADDPTLKRCVEYARGWGYGGLEITNLFAWRSTERAVLNGKGVDYVGPHNDAHLVGAARAADLVVCGWGADGHIRGRYKKVVELLRPLAKLHALDFSRGGMPKHPLYLSYGRELRDYDPDL